MCSRQTIQHCAVILLLFPPQCRSLPGWRPYMATSATEVKEEGLVLTPPEPVTPVAKERAAGLVPIDDEKRSKLDEKVDGFISDLVAQDANSPEFGARVDQIVKDRKSTRLDYSHQCASRMPPSA